MAQVLVEERDPQGKLPLAVGLLGFQRHLIAACAVRFRKDPLPAQLVADAGDGLEHRHISELVRHFPVQRLAKRGVVPSQEYKPGIAHVLERRHEAAGVGGVELVLPQVARQLEAVPVAPLV